MNTLESEFLQASLAWARTKLPRKNCSASVNWMPLRSWPQPKNNRAGMESQRAEEQARAAGQLRERALYLAGALVIALGLAFVALFLGAQAQRSAGLAQAQQRVASSAS